MQKEQSHIHSLAAYGIISDTPVPKERVIVCFRNGYLVEAYYLRTFLQLSHIPHFTTLQKFTERISGTLLEKIISSFIILTKIGHLFVGIDSSGFKATHASQYYTERVKLRRKYIKLSLAADVLQQIICTIKIRRAPTRHDSIDFRPLITKISELVPLSVVTADKGYDSEDNHVLVRDILHALVLYQQDMNMCQYERHMGDTGNK